MQNPIALRSLTTFLLTTLALVAMVGCGTQTYRPSALAPFEMDPEFEINDDDIEKAFEARPQLPERFKVAYFSYDTKSVDAIEAAIAEVPGVEGEPYRIPPLLVSGAHRYDPDVSRYYAAANRKPLSLKKLRMHAARAGCDVLMIFDYGYRQSGSPNGLVAFNVLMLPTLFSPFLDVTIESYMDAYLIDVRNGYLYGHITGSATDVEEYVTIYGLDDHPFIGAHATQLIKETEEAMKGVVDANKNQARALREAPEPAGAAVDGGAP